MGRIVIYITTGCIASRYCYDTIVMISKSREILDKKGIPYSVVNISDSTEDEYVSKLYSSYIFFSVSFVD